MIRTAVALAALLLVVLAAGVHSQAFDPAETCEGTAEGAECWKQLSSHPGCHVWNRGPITWKRGLIPEQTATWSGACNGSVADGEGVLTWADREGAIVYEGALVGGKPHGRGSETDGNGSVAEGTYAAGQPAGRWRVTFGLSGIVDEGIFANGRPTGRWITRYGDGMISETPYVNGEEHGTQVTRHGATAGPLANRVTETPYVNGEIHGTKVTRDAAGNVIRETPYVNGEKHGTEVWRFTYDSYVRITETPWVNGERHGTEVKRNADGNVIERVRYVNGERQDP